MSTRRLTVADLKPHLASVGYCFPQDNARLYIKLTEAEERMQVYGRWFGSIQEVQFCVRDCLLIWPREVDVIEQLSLPYCTGPIDIHNAWYDYIRPIYDGTHHWNNAIAGWPGCAPVNMSVLDRQPVSFDVTNASRRTLRFYPTHASDVGKTVIVQGNDSNGIWVRTSVGGTVIDGEQVTLALPFADTTTTWEAGNPLGLQKQVTNYRVLMYDHDLLTMQDRLLGIYQPGETNPVYRVSKIPFLGEGGGCCGSESSSCTLTTIRALVKLASVPFASDGDWLLYRNISAYKEALLAIRDWENGDLASGNFHFFGAAAPKQSRMSNQATLSKGGCIPLLRAEQRSMSADRTEVVTHYGDERFVAAMSIYR